MRNLPRATAMAAYRRACRHLGEQPHQCTVRQGYPGWPAGGPVLCEYFEDRYRWAIVWERSNDWTVQTAERENRRPRTPVLAEPLNGYSLALFPRGQS